jgi:hypothetical protein
MKRKGWRDDVADRLVDEIPGAYKDIDTVMADSADLVEIVHTLRQVANSKVSETSSQTRTGFASSGASGAPA